GTLAKIQALAKFVQGEVRYVAIEIGIGGFRPHPAQDILRNRYGDCKDKATLLSALLREIGVESYYVLINSRRGVVLPEFPSAMVFDHVILAIRIPADVSRENMNSTLNHPQIGWQLFFDPTDSDVPFGYIPAQLQSNY